LLASGYRFLHLLHEDRRAAYYLTTIAEDNESAVRLLTSRRAGLPVYHACGTFHTLSLSTSLPTAQAATNGALYHGGIEIRPASASDRDAILQFLNEHGPARQFFPVYESHDLFSGSGLLRGLACEDVLLAQRDERIVGTLACWNQRAFKQIVVHGYGGWLRPMRPLYNAWATLRHRPTLPIPGSTLPVRLAAIPVVRDNDPAVFRQLLEGTLRRLAEWREPLLLVGLHENDPLLPIARQYAGRDYRTTLYIVYWPEDVPDLGQLHQRVPYLELGCL
jgi:hypothetical protein